MKKHFQIAALAVLTMALLSAVACSTQETGNSGASAAGASQNQHSTEAKVQTPSNGKVPAGFNEHDYLKFDAFLQIEDENGVKNQEKWLDRAYEELAELDENRTRCEVGNELHNSFTWEKVDGEFRLTGITLKDNVQSLDTVGRLDFSGCTTLERVTLNSPPITEIDFSGCTALETLLTDKCGFEKLNISRISAPLRFPPTKHCAI